ncbi:Hypothetical predicted protein [Mytilus galloprovincialis]|uniref:Uncharacterized protein n=1 Tax=Mytilus galloprovincialis TaxID=29158 RepID=A0A8B6E7N9_MYTGA|nr:Hypothetical predicted protein [Mytilus galloprovincialis]
MGILTDETSQKQLITDTTLSTDANNNGKYTKPKTPILTKNQHTETEQVDNKITVTDEIQSLETSVTHKISQTLDNQNSNFQTLKTEIEQSSRNETHVLMDKLDKKDEEIEKFSTSNRSLSDKLDNLFEHNLNLKSQLPTLLDPQQAQVKHTGYVHLTEGGYLTL